MFMVLLPSMAMFCWLSSSPLFWGRDTGLEKKNPPVLTLIMILDIPVVGMRVLPIWNGLISNRLGKGSMV